MTARLAFSHLLRLIALLMGVIISPGVFASFFDEHQQGWFWRQDSQNPAQKPTALKDSVSLSHPTETMKALQKKIEDSINLAILSPTEQNLKNYASAYYEVIHRSQRFTDAYRWMLLKNPEFDYGRVFPVNALSQAVYTHQREQAIHRAVKRFAAEYGFLFFFKKRCAYCRLFASTVKQFADKYGVSVIPISLDGGTLPEFPTVSLNHAAADKLNVQALPALFALNPHTQAMIPITHRAISLLEMEDNIAQWAQADSLQDAHPPDASLMANRANTPLLHGDQ